MERSHVFFIFALSFISGIAYASLGLSILFSLIPAAIVFTALFAWSIDTRVAFLAALFVVLGCTYYAHDDATYSAKIAAIPQSISVQGIITEDPKHSSDFESFYIDTDYGRIAVQTKPDTNYAYGDEVTVQGKTLPPTSAYFARHVVAILRDPAVTLVAGGKGNPVLAFLFRVKASIKESYARVLSPPRAALLFAIMFGDNSGISKEFAQKLDISGLRFMTAIDGLHMQVVILIVFGMFLFALPRSYAYAATAVFAILFVALTGLTLSGLRACAMAFLAIIAKETGRVYQPHVILSFIALVLALIDPKVLLFDVGFQLSFLAVISIIYFLPILKEIVRYRSPGFLNWYESFLITISVLLFTAPLSIVEFQSFSFTAFIASTFVVWMLPYLLILGLLLAMFAWVFFPAAYMLGAVLSPLVDYVAIVASVFARMAVLFNPPLPFTAVVAYYGGLISFMYWYARRPQKLEKEEKLQPIAQDEIAAQFEIIEIV